MKIDLASMARMTGSRKKSFELRAIHPTQIQARDLYRIYLPVVRAWEAGARNRLMPAYGRTIAELQTDSVIDMETIIILIGEYVASVEITARLELRRFADRMVRWHMQRLISNIKYVTNVDVSTMIGPQDMAMTIDDFMVRNMALIRDVSDQTRGRISDIVFRNAQLRTPIRDVAREISEATGLARKRSLRIAMDQTQKISSALDRERQLQLGIEEFEWMHSGKAHPRPEHVARDKKIFRWDSEVALTDPPGFAPFCGCKARGVIE